MIASFLMLVSCPFSGHAQAPSSPDPRLEIALTATNLLLHLSFQNTQGVYFVQASDTPERVWGYGESVAFGPIPASGAEDLVLPLDLTNSSRFFALVEHPLAATNDFELPGPSGEVTNTSPLGFLGTQGLPDFLVAGDAFDCAFILFGTNGLPLPVDGEARLVLTDAVGAPVAFAYAITPPTVRFSNGVAVASVIVQTTNGLYGCRLALAVGDDYRPARESWLSLMTMSLILEDIIGPDQTLASSPVPGALTTDPTSPTYLTDLRALYQQYRQSHGTANPVWSYPSAGERRATGTFGEWYRTGYRIHTGIDLHGPAGRDVLAAEQGIVSAVVNAGDNSYIVVDHGYGAWTLYQHVYINAPQCRVRLLDAVTRGQVITQTYPTTTSHLHFGIRTGAAGNLIQYQCQPGTAVNPIQSFSSVIFKDGAKAAPEIRRLALTPANRCPATFQYPTGNANTSSLIQHGQPGTTYVLVQVVDIHHSLAPYEITLVPEFPLTGPPEVYYSGKRWSGTRVPDYRIRLRPRGHE